MRDIPKGPYRVRARFGENRPPVRHFVYVVRWPDGVWKAGYSGGPRRWRHFELRGATVVDLCEHPTIDAALEAERLTLAGLAARGVRAFVDRHAAEGHLGAGGGGYRECWRLAPDAWCVP